MMENDSMYLMEKHLEMMIKTNSIHPMVNLSAMSLAHYLVN